MRGWERHRLRGGAGVSGSSAVGPIDAAPEQAAAPSERAAVAGEARAARASAINENLGRRQPK